MPKVKKVIPFDNFRSQYKRIRLEIDAAVRRVLESGRFILGRELEAFEFEFSSYIGSKYAVGVASGTDAIALSLIALGIGRGDEVITSSLTAFPTISGIMKSGATPVVIEISPGDGLLDVSRIEEKMTGSTKALLPVHLYGQSCDMETVCSIAEKHGIRIVEDCAQSAGATYRKKKTGCFGDTGAFSFYPTKNLGAYGDGGMVVTGDRALYERLLRLRNYGKTGRDRHAEFGFNSRLDEIQAAVLRVKLNHLEDWNAERRAVASFYRSRLEGVSCLRVNDYGVPVFHLFVIQSGRRNSLRDYLSSRGIPTLIHYPEPVYRQPAFPLRLEKNLRNAERFAKSVLSIPLYPELSGEDRERIVRAVNDFTEEQDR